MFTKESHVLRSSPRRNRAGRVERCLPPGKVIESDETLEQTAVREVAEETGIVGRVLVSLGTVDYWFSRRTRSSTRSSTTTFARSDGVASPSASRATPMPRQAIDVAWFPLLDVQTHLTFPNERRIAQAAWERLAGET